MNTTKTKAAQRTIYAITANTSIFEGYVTPGAIGMGAFASHFTTDLDHAARWDDLDGAMAVLHGLEHRFQGHSFRAVSRRVNA